MELHKNEKVYWQSGPNKLATILTPRILIEVIIAAFLLHPTILGAIYNIGNQLGVPREYMNYFPYVPFALIAFIAFWSFIQESTKIFILTNERMIVRFGVLVRTEDEVELYRVIDAIQKINIFQRLIGVGTVIVTSSDKTGTVVMNSINDAARVRNGLRTLAERCKSKRGVRILE